MVVDKDDSPLNPRILGKPGTGKTTLVYAAGRRLGKDVYSELLVEIDTNINPRVKIRRHS